MAPKLELPVEAAARSMGNADQNESTPASERTSDMKSALGAGPLRGDAGEYLPAAYALPEIPVEKKNGTVEMVRLVREDR